MSFRARTTARPCCATATGSRSSSRSQGVSMQTDTSIDTLKIGKYEFRSRLFVGTGKYPSLEIMQQAHEESGDPETLYPDTLETIAACEELVRLGFTVLPYVVDDPIACKRLEEAGCAAVMPLAAPIGSGLGVCNPYSIRLIKERANVPVIVDAGVGTASDAAIAMELGVDALLMNTGIAAARDPVRMAVAMRHAVLAGREAFLAGRMGKQLYANASSPMQHLIGSRHA